MLLILVKEELEQNLGMEPSGQPFQFSYQRKGPQTYLSPAKPSTV